MAYLCIIYNIKHVFGVALLSIQWPLHPVFNLCSDLCLVSSITWGKYLALNAPRFTSKYLHVCICCLHRPACLSVCSLSLLIFHWKHSSETEVKTETVKLWAGQLHLSWSSPYLCRFLTNTYNFYMSCSFCGHCHFKWLNKDLWGCVAH